ncbi:hypothetical protein [Nocardiopsis ansamitocini]|uniref:Lipoprotein n=1 Tax=Nocardiopsis ansamitocini TaxID=1670832 RepID=A0A9W6P5K9_9ACTN|nr:hypothetical protein [Nocardiopsis ansamitocini]GLU47467.1 hypothetical protein Nans01_18180 [Nocardiopsis ansamitocini]
MRSLDVVATGCAVLLAACIGCSAAGIDDEEPASPEATLVNEAQSGAAETPEGAALAAYNGMWAVVVDASHAGETAPAELERYATGGALELMNQALQSAKISGEPPTGEPVLDPEVVMDGSAKANVTDCVDDSQWSVDGQSSGGAPRRVDAGVGHDGLVWRVFELRIWEPGTC